MKMKNSFWMMDLDFPENGRAAEKETGIVSSDFENPLYDKLFEKYYNTYPMLLFCRRYTSIEEINDDRCVLQTFLPAVKKLLEAYCSVIENTSHYLFKIFYKYEKY